MGFFLAFFKYYSRVIPAHVNVLLCILDLIFIEMGILISILNYFCLYVSGDVIANLIQANVFFKSHIYSIIRSQSFCEFIKSIQPFVFVSFFVITNFFNSIFFFLIEFLYLILNLIYIYQWNKKTFIKFSIQIIIVERWVIYLRMTYVITWSWPPQDSHFHEKIFKKKKQKVQSSKFKKILWISNRHVFNSQLVKTP
jgi:hypothetical protein